jgi:murein DD-endopeptidase MepM/ murein hydrolase activator NlpD
LVYAPIDGISNIYVSNSGGLCLEIINGKEKVLMCHLKERIIQGDTRIKAGQPVAYSGKTGDFCTGPHLHFSYIVNGKHQNPALSFDALFSGETMKNKDWEKSYCYHRYGKKVNYLAEFNMKFKNPWLHKQLQKRFGFPIPSTEVCNALVYGSWDYNTVSDPAMYQIWSKLTKSEYNK